MGYILPVSNPTYIQYAERMRQQLGGIPRVTSVNCINKAQRKEKRNGNLMNRLKEKTFSRYLEQELKGNYINEII
jgi:hypothetical protein